MGTVYIDELFIFNLAVNYILLYVTKKIIRTDSRRGMLVVGACIGAFYAVLMFVPGLHFMYGVIGKLIFSLCMVALTYNVRGIYDYLRVMCVFFLVNFAFGGAIYGVASIVGSYTILEEGGMTYNLPLRLFCTSSLLAYICINVYARYTRRQAGISANAVTLHVAAGGDTRNLRCIVDTGNALYEPLTGTPVIIVEYEAVRGILPLDVCVVVESSEQLLSGGAMALLESGIRRRNLRLIPYSAVGTQAGMLVGYKPDTISINGKAIDNAILGIYKGNIQHNGYAGLIHPDCMAV